MRHLDLSQRSHRERRTAAAPYLSIPSKKWYLHRIHSSAKQGAEGDPRGHDSLTPDHQSRRAVFRIVIPVDPFYFRIYIASRPFLDQVEDQHIGLRTFLKCSFHDLRVAIYKCHIVISQYAYIRGRILQNRVPVPAHSALNRIQIGHFYISQENFFSGGALALVADQCIRLQIHSLCQRVVTLVDCHN